MLGRDVFSIFQDDMAMHVEAEGPSGEQCNEDANGTIVENDLDRDER